MAFASILPLKAVDLCLFPGDGRKSLQSLLQKSMDFASIPPLIV